MPRQILLSLILLSVFIPYLWPLKGSIIMEMYQYFDEIMGVISVAFIVTNFKRLSKNEKKISFLMAILLGVGLLGTVLFRLQTKLFPVSLDAFSCVKCFAVFVYANHKVAGMSYNSKRFVLKYSEKIICIIMVVAFFCAILNLGTHFMTDDIRKGFPCFKFFCRKSSIFGNMFYVYIFFLVLAFRDSKNKKVMRYLVVITTITWMLTMRTRAILFAFIFILMFYWFIVYGKTLKVRVGSILIVLILAAFFASEKIEVTFSNDAHPRTILLSYGIKTMKDFFPIGAGFGTYGTDVAAKYYSKLYYKYNFHHAYGLNPNDTQFAHDCYWPAIMGEFGAVGAIIVAMILFYMYKEIRALYKDDKVNLVLGTFLFLTQLLASFPTSVYFQYPTVFLFLYIPLMKNSERRFLCKN